MLSRLFLSAVFAFPAWAGLKITNEIVVPQGSLGESIFSPVYGREPVVLKLKLADGVIVLEPVEFDSQHPGVEFHVRNVHGTQGNPAVLKVTQGDQLEAQVLFPQRVGTVPIQQISLSPGRPVEVTTERGLVHSEAQRRGSVSAFLTVRIAPTLLSHLMVKTENASFVVSRGFNALPMNGISRIVRVQSSKGSTVQLGDLKTGAVALTPAHEAACADFLADWGVSFKQIFGE